MSETYTKEFTTLNGLVLHYRGINQNQYNAILDAHPLPPVPTYDEIIEGEVAGQLPHNETTLETEEEQAEWDAYVAERQRVIQEQNEAIIQYALSYGLPDPDPDEVTEWEEVQAYLGVPTPEHPIAQKCAFYRRVYLSTPAEVGRLVMAILEATTIREQEVLAKANSFPDPLEGE